MSPEKLLKKHRKIYELYYELYIKEYKGSDLELIQNIKALVRFASRLHVGLFTDHRLSSKLFTIASNLPKQVITDPIFSIEKDDCQTILHIVTKLYKVGGHGAFLKRLINKDRDANHIIVVTDQEGDDYDRSLNDVLQNTNGKLIFLKDENIFLKVARLKKVAINVDLIFFHSHPEDIVPILSFAERNVPPIIMFNHADHVFSLLTSVADVVADIRYSSQEITKMKRGNENSMILPLLIDLPKEVIKDEETLIRKKLGANDNDLVLLSMGSYYKFMPAGDRNFFRIIHNLLDEIPELKVWIIGLGEDQDLEKLSYIPHPNLHLLGVLADPSPYQAEADMVIDPIPYGSYTSLLESCSYGCWPILLKNSVPMFDLTEDPGLHGMVHPCKNTMELINEIKNHINQRDELNLRIEKIRNNVIKFHYQEEWDNLYFQIKENVFNNLYTKNNVNNILNDIPDANDIALVQLNRSRVNKEYYWLTNQVLNNRGENYSKFKLKLLLSILLTSEEKGNFSRIKNIFKILNN